MRGRDPAGSSGIPPGAHGVATMIIVKAGRLDRRGVGAAGGAADSGGHPSAGRRFRDPRYALERPVHRSAVSVRHHHEYGGPAGVEHSAACLRRVPLMSALLPAAPAPATAADHSGPTARGCPALRVTVGRHDAGPFPGRHHPWQRQRHCACGAYLTVTRRRETGRRDRKRLRVTLRRPGLQGENPGKKERS